MRYAYVTSLLLQGPFIDDYSVFYSYAVRDVCIIRDRLKNLGVLSQEESLFCHRQMSMHTVPYTARGDVTRRLMLPLFSLSFPFSLRSSLLSDCTHREF
jgi:hypothetical protein